MSDEFASPSEVVCEALREMAARDAAHEERLEKLLAEIDAAAADPVRYTDAEVGEHLSRRREGRMRAFGSRT